MGNTGATTDDSPVHDAIGSFKDVHDIQGWHSKQDDDLWLFTGLKLDIFVPFAGTIFDRMHVQAGRIMTPV